MVSASADWMAVDGYVGNVVREEAAGGRAALAVSCVVGCAGACEPAVDEFALRQIKPFVQRPGEKTRRCGSPGGSQRATYSTVLVLVGILT